MIRRIKQMEIIRNYINQFLINQEIDCDENWGSSQETQNELEALADTGRDYVANSVKMLMDGKETLIFAAFHNSPEELFAQIRTQAVNLAQAQEISELHVVFFVDDMRCRIRLEREFNQTYKNQILAAARSGNRKKKVSLQSTYILNRSFSEQEVWLKNLRRHEIIQMPPISGNINLEPKKGDESKGSFFPYAAVLTIDLFQLAELYNLIGDCLFRKNVRFGINDTLGVDQSIRKTLKEEPEYFWFKNNGITILEEDPKFQLKNTERLYLGSVEAEQPPKFSVINGAQTISTAAEYFFELEQDKSREEELKKAKTAQVLLRIICPPKAYTDEQRAISEQKTREISVALNRQKPIKTEDIAFTTPYARKLVDYLAGKPADSEMYFQLIRRGESMGIGRELDLVQFSRARLACAGLPGDARSKGTKEFLKIRQDENNTVFINKNVFVDGWMETAGDDEDRFFRCHYGTVWFAHRIAQEYEAICKKPYDLAGTEEDEDILIVIANGKWCFTAVLIQMLNRFSMSRTNSREELPDFSGFEGSFSSIQSRLSDAILLFAKAVVAYMKTSGKTERIDSNLFKGNTLYRELVRELKEIFFPTESRTVIAKLQEFAAFLLSDEQLMASAEAAAAEPSGQEAGYIRLNDRYMSVGSVAHAMQETVQYILTNYAISEKELLERCKGWITGDLAVARADSGYFRGKPRSIRIGEQIYWVGTSSNTAKKSSQIADLCRLAAVPQGEIRWQVLSPDTPEFAW